MTLDFFIHTILASTLIYFTWKIWWKGMPAVIVVRGRYHGFAAWVLGMSMALFANSHLAMAYAQIPVAWLRAAGDVCLIAYVSAYLTRIYSLGKYAWGKCPDTVGKGECS